MALVTEDRAPSLGRGGRNPTGEDELVNSSGYHSLMMIINEYHYAYIPNILPLFISEYAWVLYWVSFLYISNDDY